MSADAIRRMRESFLEALYDCDASRVDLELCLDECRMRLASYRRVESTMPPPETRRSVEVL